MTDIANLVLAVDSTQITRGTAALDGLAASGARAEAATVGLSSGFRGAGTEATALAAAAQLSARAAVDQASGLTQAASAARVNTLAMRETLVVARELARGNFTRLPGSLTLLAQGVGSQGGIGAYGAAIAQQLGLIKQVQDAELAEAAAAAASAAAGVEAAARKAAANVMAADTEVALAEAQLLVAEGSTAEAAAQERLAAANAGVAAAATEATIAEDALAVAMGRANEAQAASAAATKTLIGGSAVGLIGIGTVAGLAYASIKQFQDQVKDSGSLDKFADSLNLTDEQVKKLGGSVTYLGDGTRQISDLTVSFGDVMAGVWEQVTAKSDGAFGNMQTAAGSAFSGILSFWNQASAALSAGLWTLGDIAKDVFQYIGQLIGQSFYNGVNSAIDALNSLNARIPKALGGGDPNLIAHLKPNTAVSTLGGLGSTIRAQSDANYAAALAANHAAFTGVQNGAIQHARNRLQTLSNSNKPKKGKKPKTAKQKTDPADDISARLDDQILAAKEKLAGGAEELAALQIQQIDVEKNKTIEDAAQKLAEGKITAGEDAHIVAQADQLAELKKQAVLRQEQTTLLTQQQAAQDQLFGFQTDALKAADEAAKSQADHRTLQLQMLDVQYEQLTYDREIALNKAKIAGVTTDIARAQAALDHTGTEKQYAQAAVLKNTQDPLQAWMDKIPNDAASITEALQGIETKGFDTLASGIAAVITGTESLGKAFKDISTQIIGDIIQMTVKMLIFRAISGILGGGNFLATGADQSFGASGVLGGGTAASMSIVPHWANGGAMIIGGNSGVDQNMLSMNGKPLAMVGQGETLSVFPRPAANSNGSSGDTYLTVQVDAKDAVLTDAVQGWIVQGIAQAAPHIIAHSAKATTKVLMRPKIIGGR